jgi:hypothetical protein
MSKIKKEKEIDVITQKGVSINLMVITSTRSGPRVHLTITTTFIIYLVISSTHFGPMKDRYGEPERGGVNGSR